MAFMSMFLVMILFLITIVGIVILITGIILDVIWGVRKKKKKKVSIPLKVFAILATVLGILVAGGPAAAVGLMSLGFKIADHQEIAEFDKEELVHVDDFQDIYEDGIYFKGDHYVMAEDLKPQKAHDNFYKEKAGAVVDGNDKHRIIYTVNNLMGITILDIEHSSGVFVKDNDVEKVVEYYEKEAPLYCEITPRYELGRVVRNVDSARIREYRDRILADGTAYSGELSKTRAGSMLFYSEDDMCCIDFSYSLIGDGVRLFIGKNYIDLDEDDSAFILTIIDS